MRAQSHKLKTKQISTPNTLHQPLIGRIQLVDRLAYITGGPRNDRSEVAPSSHIKTKILETRYNLLKDLVCFLGTPFKVASPV